MALISELQGDQRKRITDHYETFLRSMALLRGDRLSADQVSRIVGEAVAGASPEELRSPVPPASAISRLQQLLVQTVEAGRPHNLYGAEAARAAQAAGGDGARGGVGLGTLDAIRGSSSRYRDLPSGDSMKAAGTSGSTAVAPEFARSFAGTGMVGGTLRTFAEVGLDRSTFDAFRREGFSHAQIADSARDSKVLGWHGRDDLSIAQHASTDARKAAVATEQAKTAAQQEECLKRERALEEKNEARPDSDPQKHHNRRFWNKRHEDWQKHSAKAGLGSAAREQGSAISSPTNERGAANRAAQDGQMAKGKQSSGAKLASSNEDDFGMAAEPVPSKPTPVKTAAAKPAAGPKPA